MAILTPFVRRHNQDSTVDSICTKCYQTVATERDEDHLSSAEQGHICNTRVSQYLEHADRQPEAS
jgi:hypothetical protein